MSINQYTLVEQREIPELHVTGYLYSHNGTGARVLYLYAPEDDNQTFCISFGTPPENDCGIPHILEHCVLNGSEKYPVKEPIVELLKGSMKTYLNAMTYPDKTMFPVASRNEKDFMNLVSVYLDAVFFPNLRRDPYIFMQEGWHPELNSPDEPITYKGVVYNEMKGAFSSPEEVLSYTVDRALFPDNLYGYCSGGYPEAIPDLTYEQFCQFHQRYYHPTNSYIFFYGNGDMNDHLTYLDEAYLSRFTRDESHLAAYPLQPRREKPVDITATYAIGEEEEESEKTLLCYASMLDPVENGEAFFVLDMLEGLLTNGEASPLRRALMDAGIGQEVYGYIEKSIHQPKLVICAINAEPEQKDDFVRIIREQLKKISEEGFDAKLVESTLASAEFALREANYGTTPKGLLYGIQCMDGWLYGKNPLDYLQFDAYFRKMHEDTDIFRRTVAEKLWENPHTVTVTLLPEKGKAMVDEQRIKAKLSAWKNSLDADSLEQMCLRTTTLKKRQRTPDSPEALATLPMLEQKDLQPVKPIRLAVKEDIGGREALIYTGFTNDIIYLSLYFNMDRLPEELIPYAQLLSDVLGSMDTESFSYMDLDNEIGLHLGGLGTHTTVLAKEQGGLIPYLIISAKFLTEKGKEAVRLLREILFTTDLDRKERLEELIGERYSQMESNVTDNGDRFASARVRSYYNPNAAYNEKLSGLDYFWFIRDLNEHFEQRAGEITENLRKTADILLRRQNLKARACFEEKDHALVQELIAGLTGLLPEGESPYQARETVRVTPVAKNEGIIYSGQVQFVACSGRYQEPFTGDAVVMSQALRLDYLWNRVRAQGGAYGCSASIERISRAVVFSSYRDPNLAETLKAYEEAAEAMETMEISDSELLKYKIGTLSGLNPATTVSMNASIGADRVESGAGADMISVLSQEVLDTTPEKIRQTARILRQAMQDPYICVIGSESSIRQNADRFDTVINLL